MYKQLKKSFQHIFTKLSNPIVSKKDGRIKKGRTKFYNHS